MDDAGELTGTKSRRDLLEEWRKHKEQKISSTPSQQRAEKISYVTPQTRPQPSGLLQRQAPKTDRIAKTLFHEGKENCSENYNYPGEEFRRKREVVKPTRIEVPSEHDKSLSREEQLRLWKERKQQSKPSTKPRPNPASFASTSSLFDPPRSQPRLAPARPVLAVRTKSATKTHEPSMQEEEEEQEDFAREPRLLVNNVVILETENDTGNEGGDERELVREDSALSVGEDQGIKSEDEREGAHEEEGGLTDVSALLSGDDEMLEGLGKWQKTFKVLLHQIEERLRLIHEGGIHAETARVWIKSLKPKYGNMTQYYVLWAIFEERLMLFENANQVYEEGILERAEPQYELLKEYRAFLDRKAQSDINRFNKTVEALSSSLAQSKMLQSPPRSSISQPTSNRKSTRTPKRLLTPSRISDDPTLVQEPSSPYRDTMNDIREPVRERDEDQEAQMDGNNEESPVQKMDLNESLLDNFQHMEILTPRVYKSTPPRHTSSPHTPPHTPPSIPNEISDFSPVSPGSPSTSQQPTTPRLLTTPSRVVNMEAILRDSMKAVMTRYNTPSKPSPSSYVVFEKVALSKEESEELGAEFAVTPVRKFGVRPKSVNRELLQEVGYVYTPSKRKSVLFKEEQEDEAEALEASNVVVKPEIKEEEYEVSTYHADAEDDDDEKQVHSDSKTSEVKTPKNRKRSRSACPITPNLGTFESLEITRKRSNSNLEEAISIVATPHKSARKSTSSVTPANTPKRKKVRMDIKEEEDDESGEETISVTNVRRSKRISVATPIKLPGSQKKAVKVIFTPNYHRSSNITDGNQLASMIDMTHQDYYVSSD